MHFFVKSHTIIEKSKSLGSKFIALLLLQKNLEANPSPNKENIRLNLILRTYNCDGLGELEKLKELLTKFEKEIQLRGIALWQETNIVDKKIN